MRKRRTAANSREGESTIPRLVRLSRRIIGYKRVRRYRSAPLAANFLFVRCSGGISAIVSGRLAEAYFKDHNQQVVYERDLQTM